MSAAETTTPPVSHATPAHPVAAATPECLAALDIGTNSFHLVVARFADDGHRFEVVTREKEMVRLGSGSGDMKLIEPDAMDRGIDALDRMRQIAEIHDAPMVAVATSAVREADNADEFLRRARDEAGVEVDVITGLEEARLIYLGVLQAVPVYDKQIVLIDIGGGSTEILIGRQGETVKAGSLKLGCIRLTRRFFKQELLHPASVDSCRRFVRAALAPMTRPVKKRGFDVAVGSSGTISAVAMLIQRMRDDDVAEPRTFNNFEFTRKEVKAVVRLLAEAPTLAERREIKGIDPRRADILLAGAIILEQAMAELGITTMFVSDYALREGVLLDARERLTGASRHHLHDLRGQSVQHLATLMDEDPEHSRRTAELALELFDQTVKWHELDDAARELLEAAALLANVGQFVSHDKHHKHSYYVIRNTDQLPGFTDHEIELIALIARYHRKSLPRESHPEYRHLRDDDQHTVSVLAGILRIAIALDRTHAGLIGGLSVKREGKGDERRLVISVWPADGAGKDTDHGPGDGPADDGDGPAAGERGGLSLEIYTANERKDLLETELGLRIDVVEANPPGD